MSIFNSDYTQQYDLFYKDKNYQAEADYVAGLIQTFQPESKTILDLGCGTGRHDSCFINMGFSTVGVDSSNEMIQLSTRTHSGHNSPKFVLGDIRHIRLDSIFDVVVSLFHVISYQTTNQDITDTFDTARSHLSPGGLFIFDFWYGPAVLTDLPAVRCREFNADDRTVVRIAEPELLPNNNSVKIAYNIFFKAAGDDKYKRSCETHTMRYFFEPELHDLAHKHGFDIVRFCGWMSNDLPDLSTWYATAVCRAK